jgi:hypothetical protein
MLVDSFHCHLFLPSSGPVVNYYKESTFLQRAHTHTHTQSIFNCKNEGKVVPLRAMKACRESGGVAPLILNFNISSR